MTVGTFHSTVEGGREVYSVNLLTIASLPLKYLSQYGRILSLPAGRGSVCVCEREREEREREKEREREREIKSG